MSANYSDFEYLFYRSPIYNGHPWNWTTMPDIELAPDVNGTYQVSYSFITDKATQISYYNGTGFSSFQELYDSFQAANGPLQALVDYVMNPTDAYSGLFSDVANIEFINPTSGRGMIDIAVSTAAVEPGTHVLNDLESRVPVDYAIHGDIWLTVAAQSSGGVGTKVYQDVVHEIAHALGLKHPFDGSPSTTSFTHQYTTMSYDALPGMKQVGYESYAVHPFGLQILDIAALQKIYGRNYTTRSASDPQVTDGGNTIYKEGNGFGHTKDVPFIYTIWDGGGVDTIDLTSYDNGVLLDLRQGYFSSVGKANDATYNSPSRGAGLIDANLAIAFHTVIENAKGTVGNDIIIGNLWENELLGNDGDDKLYGEGSLYDYQQGYIGVDNRDALDPNRAVPFSDDDILRGGRGKDEVYGGKGNDTLIADASASGLLEGDLYDGGVGHDTLDYSNVVLGSGKGISLTSSWAKAWDGTTTSGIQDDILGIENFILTDANDRFERGSIPNHLYATINGGGGSDTAVYAASHTYTINNLVIDNRVTSETKIWSSNGLGADRLINFETIAVGGISIILPDENTSTGSGSPFNPNRDFVDYSGATVAATMLLNNDDSRIANSTAVLGSVTHEFRTAYMTGVPQLITQITGTNHGDTIDIASWQNGTKDWTYSNFRVVTGTGDDTVHVYVAPGTTGVTLGYDIRLTYTGGDDVYNIDMPISEIRLANTIMLADVSVNILSYGSNSVTARLDIAGHGTLTFSLSHSSSTSMTVRLDTGGSININTSSTYSTTGSSTAATTIYGTWGDDVWVGRSSAETYYGKDGNDVITGGGGNDTLYGGAGDDTYIFASGFSSSATGDRIVEAYGGGEDTIKFIGGILPANVYLWTNLSGNLTFQLDSSPSNNTLTADGLYSTTDGISVFVEKVEFDDSTVWDLTNGLHLRNNNTGRGVFGTVYADTIEGGTAADTLYGYAGADTLVGKAGDDTLIGGYGDDVYIFGSNFSSSTAGDVVIENAGGGLDTIRFVDAIDPDDMFIWTDNAGYLWLQLGTGASTHTLKIGVDYAGGTGVTNHVERFEFDDNTVWDMSEGLYLRNNNTGRSLYGSSYDDEIYGGAGNDVLRGYGGNDLLSGGTGTNHYYGGNGADRFVYKAGDSDGSSYMDYIWDFKPSEGDIIDIADILSYDPLVDTLSNFVNLQASSGNYYLRVDTDGTGTAQTWQYLAFLENVSGNLTGITVNDLVNNGSLIVA